MDCCSGLLATITVSSVSIRDTDTWAVPALCSFELTPESVADAEPLTWVRFVKPSVLAFGSCCGTVYVSRIEGRRLQAPREVNVSAAILATFSCYGRLGICTCDSLLFVDESCQVVASVMLGEVAGGIRSVEFVEPFLSCVIGDQPHFLTIDERTVVNGKALPMIKALPIRGIYLTAFSPDAKWLAVAKSDGVVLVLTTGYRAQKPVTVSRGDEGDRVVAMTWSHDSGVLNVWKVSGLVVSLSLVGESLSTTTVEMIRDSVCMCHDCGHSRVYVSKGEKLVAVEMMRNFNRFCVSSYEILDPTVGKSIFKDKHKTFPMKMIETDIVTGSLFIAGNEGFVIVDSSGNLSEMVRCKVCHAGFLGKFLVVVSEKQVQIYNTKLVLLHSRELDFCPTNFALSQCRGVVSGKMDVLELCITDSPMPKNFHFTKLGCYFLYWRKIKMKQLISGALPWGADDFLVHFAHEDCVRLYSDWELRVCQNVDRMWMIQELPIAFFQCGRYVTIKVGDKMVKIEGAPYYANPYEVMFLCPEIQFGSVVAGSRPYGYFFLTKFLNQKQQLDELFGCYSKMSKWPQILSDATIYSFSNGTARLWVPMLPTRLPDNLVAEVVGITVKLLSKIKKEMFFKYAKYPWKQYFPLMGSDTRLLTLMSLVPSDFMRLYADDDCEYNRTEFVRLAVAEHQLLRGFLVSVSVGVDICHVFSSEAKISKCSLDDGILFFEESFTGWEDVPEFHELCVFLGSTLQVGGMSGLALALFIVLGQREKVKAIMLIDDCWVKMVSAYLTEYPMNKYRSVMREALDDVADVT